MRRTRRQCWTNSTVRGHKFASLYDLRSVPLVEDSEEEDEGQGEEEDELPEAFTKGDKNSQLAVGFKGDRSYVVRGNNIGVFRHSGDQDQDQVKYYATIGNIAGPKGKKFNPKKVPDLWCRMKHILILRILGHAARLR